MAALALILWALYGLLALGVRVALQLRRTGSSGVVGTGAPFGSPQWLAAVGAPLAVALGVAAAALQLANVVATLPALDGVALRIVALCLYAAGLAAIVAGQEAMGSSWRVGVEADARTALVAAGPFRLVRNPIFTGMIVMQGGLALLTPNPVALAGFALLVGSIEVHTRLAEEPYLRRVHGAAYREYAAKVGRFLPGIGRLR